LIGESISGAKRSLKTTVSQARHAPKTRLSDCPDPVPIGLMDAIGRNAIVSALLGLPPPLGP